MLCVRCGFPASRHIRADGSCLDATCPKFLDKWPAEEVKAPAPELPFDHSEDKGE